MNDKPASNLSVVICILIIFTLWFSFAANSPIGPVGYIELYNHEGNQEYQENENEYLPDIYEIKQILLAVKYDEELFNIALNNATSYQDVLERISIIKKYGSYEEYQKPYFLSVQYALIAVILILILIKANKEKFKILRARIFEMNYNKSCNQSVSTENNTNNENPTAQAPGGENYNSADENYKLAMQYFAQREFFKAIECFRNSAEAGNPESMYKIGVMYRDGLGCRQDYATAKEWFGKACDHGLQPGCTEYAKLNKAGY